MKHARVSACATVALFAVAVGCSSAEPRERSPGVASTLGATNMQGATIQEQDHGWAALVEADRRMKVLQDVRESMDDPLFKDAVTQQIEMILARSNALLDEMSAGDGRVHDERIRRRTADLQWTLGAGAAGMQGNAP